MQLKRRGKISIIVTGIVLCLLSPVGVSAQDSVREWTDSTGRFKVKASLLEVVDGNAMLRGADGRTLKIPLARLSKKDQEYLQTGDSPFEMVAGDAAGSAGAMEVSDPAAMISAQTWRKPAEFDWSEVKQFATLAGVKWQVPESSGELGFEPKRVPLLRKASFHENLHSLAVNKVCKRAIVGYTVSFGVPKPQSRLSLVDLLSGTGVHSDPIDAQMRPLALLDNANTALMVGLGDRRGNSERKAELQLWQFSGKKIVRSASWVPYASDKNGGREDGDVLDAEVLNQQRLLTLSDKGHVVLWDLTSRQPIWHARLSERNFDMQLSADRRLLALFDEKTLMVLHPETAEILGSTALAPNTATGWCRLAWSPSGERIALTSISDVRVLDVKTGEWIYDFSLPGGPVATKAMSYPDENFLLLDNQLLVDLESRIQVCEYRGAGDIESIGETSFVALHSDSGGQLAPLELPHPGALEMLQLAQQDPTLFLLHPGVEVGIDVSAISGPQREAARQGLETSATQSGYTINASSPIKVVGSISEPKQEAVSYIAAGSYIVNQYTSTVKIQWNGSELWSTSRTNVPSVLMTKRGQTMQEALDEAGKGPNMTIFGSLRFPEFMQKPSQGRAAGRRTQALMSAQFTLQGVVDSK
ncbi:SHD1 domain-containing protein [Planctomycetaceae bacterium SH139]